MCLIAVRLLHYAIEKLPFLTQDHATVSSVPAISFFVSLLAKSTSSGAWDFDASLSVLHRTKRTAWYSQVEANIGDSQTYSFYSLDDNNFGKLKNPTMLPISQHHYVPARTIREIHRSRSFGKGPRKDDQAKTEYALAFEQDNIKLSSASLATLNAKLLNVQKFFFGDRPMTLNVYIASHVLLLLNPPFPDQLTRSILMPIRPLRNPPKTMKSRMDEADLRFRRWIWFKFALAFGGVACCIAQLCIKEPMDWQTRSVFNLDCIFSTLINVL
ncbi:uncharacterized protein F5891DRAFT_964456 [Suillus fuscotomentosus]|uniref:Mitochondrial outer membrane transport complex Sam37/metaxin N-terminal domain-containing protein n=1 Tax=Suillus fuscotomentosus TaxID=1912939 RepID=A0AAD4DRB1_9AGAM|nr:uncharacterized protein F5891DRAFT_964456 [Suillus fuscotomentosus]KAG1891572.1 hypothetical protein F5891DRAFT_964456 [Suillus fuscotomentosus]